MLCRTVLKQDMLVQFETVDVMSC